HTGETMARDGSSMNLTARTALAAALLALGGVASAAFADDNQSRNPSSGMTPDLNDPRISGDFDYGVCRGTNPKCYHDWVDSRQTKVLLYPRTAGPRHANLGTALGPGLNPPLNTGANPNTVQTTLMAWLEAEGIAMDWTEDVNQLASSLGPSSRYKAVIFASTSRDTLEARHGHRADVGSEHHHRRAPRRGQDRSAPVHARGRRLRSDPQRVRHRVQLALLRRPSRQRQLLRPRPVPGRYCGNDCEGSFDGRPAGTLGLQGRVVQPRALPNQGEVPPAHRRGHARDQALDASRSWQVPSGRVVPVLRRRPRLLDHARA